PGVIASGKIVAELIGEAPAGERARTPEPALVG
ncbi:MAG: hypothetical protein RLZZ621_90, partial [Gemmatimonadota bacterium]